MRTEVEIKARIKSLNDELVFLLKAAGGNKAVAYRLAEVHTELTALYWVLGGDD